MSTQHKRWVMIKLAVVYPYEVPLDWTEDDIDFHLQESSSCASNRVNYIQDVLTAKATTCWCDHAEEGYVREANQKDLVSFGIKEAEKNADSVCASSDRVTAGSAKDS